MNTFFAPAERARERDLKDEIAMVGANPIVAGLLQSVNGLLAVLNEHRQLVALNDALSEKLGIEDTAMALGLRPGEALQCIHAYDEPAGCGTTMWCSTCGAAIAMVTSLEEDKPVERVCALSVKKGDKEIDIVLQVKSHPIRIGNHRFLLFFIQDITQQQHRAALERAFYHDVNNTLGMLLWASEMLMDQFSSDLVKTIHLASLRLRQEIAIQHALSQSQTGSYQPIWHTTTLEQTFEELRSFFTGHAAANNKTLEFRNSCTVSIVTDVSVLFRILCNMVINALEATAKNGLIRIWAEQEGDTLTFCVWNAEAIPKETARRIFQRNFSTKNQAGRGLGTFSMKLLGEKILGGKVAFTSSPEAGTIFRYSLPLSLNPEEVG